MGCAAIAVAGCKSEPGGLAIKRELKTDSTKSSGLPGPGLSLDEATPSLAIEGVEGPVLEGMRERLARSTIAPKGGVTVDVQGVPRKPGMRGTVQFVMKAHAAFVHPPEMSALDATFTGTLTYRETSPARLGEELGDIVDDWLTAQKLPENLGKRGTIADPIAVTVGPPHCALHADKSVRCWEDGEQPLHIPALTPTVSLDAGNNYGVCGVRENGRVYCVDAWDNTVAYEARDVCGVEGATSVSVGQQSACALLADGTVRCWGARAGWFEPCGERAAVAVQGVTDAVAIDTGPFRGCAVDKAGGVACWELCGKGCKSGVVGEVDTPPTAAPVKGLSKVTTVLAAFDICGASGDTVTCVPNAGGTPRRVKLPAPVNEVFRTMRDTCARLADGTIHCWASAHDAPTETLKVVTFRDVIDADAGLSGLCAASTQNGVSCVIDPSGTIYRAATPIGFSQ